MVFGTPFLRENTWLVITEAAPEQTEFDVELTDAGAKKIQVIKAIREITRITSYNVCYTKLLRYHARRNRRQQCHPAG